MNSRSLRLLLSVLLAVVVPLVSLVVLEASPLLDNRSISSLILSAREFKMFLSVLVEIGSSSALYSSSSSVGTIASGSW